MDSGTSACLTRSLRTCVASVPSAVEPVRGICDCERPGQMLVTAEAAEAIRRIDVLCPWLVGCGVLRGTAAEPLSVLADMRADMACKENYAVHVKKIMPRARDSASQIVPGSLPILPTDGMMSHVSPFLGLTERN